MNISNHAARFFLCAMFTVLLANPASAKIKVGDPAPDFQVTTFDKQKLTLVDFKGKVLLINIWATWCAPCKQEMPLIDAFYRSTEQYGLRVVAVTTENSVPTNMLKPLQNVLKIPLARYFKGKYDVVDGAVPSNFVIDRAGVVRYAQAGSFDLDDLNRILIPLLNEPAP